MVSVAEENGEEDEEATGTPTGNPKRPKYKSTLFDNLTVLAVPYWYHDVDDLRELIAEDARTTFKATKQTMDILSHYVFLGQIRKLAQLAKTDSSIPGVQLAKLLSFDFTTERGRSAATKNAFALLRRQQYIEAAAVFLLSSPPMLNDATRVSIFCVHSYHEFNN